MHMRVDRHEEVGGRDRPEPEIDPVRGADHPAQVEQQTLARAPRSRVAHEVAGAPVVRIASQPIRETAEALAEISVSTTPLGHKRLAERTVRVQ